MPAVTVTISYPRGFFTPEAKKHFMTQVKKAVAPYMDAVNPLTGELTVYTADPDKFIDLLLVPYEADDAEVTAAFLATIVAFDWPDRMWNIGSRVVAITDRVRPLIRGNQVPAGQKAISFTFIAAGGWHSA